MKRIYFVGLLILVNVVCALGQGKKVDAPGREQIIQPMLILGMNVSQVDGDNLSGFRKFGANAGVGAFIRLPKNLSTSFEILYSQKGARSGSVERQAIGGRYKLILDYIDIPLMVNYHDKDRAIFGLGVVVNNLIRNKETCTCTIKEGEYRRFALEGVLSMTFLIKNTVGVNFRYSYSLSKINSAPIPRSGLDGNQQRHNILGIRVMYIFK